MPPPINNERDQRRRQAILDAARHCFLQFGYAKTSLDDIARRAGISRPLIYRKYRNKEEVLGALFEYLLEWRYPLAQEAVAARGSRRTRLLRLYEILLLEPWDEVMNAPMASEFYDACARLMPEVEAKHERQQFKLTQAVLGDRELAELFMLAVEGLQSGLPSTKVLRKRVEALIDRFID
jgi:AcrR family transcriptional regulator